MLHATVLVVACTLAAACSTTPLESAPDSSAGRGYRVGMQLQLRAERMIERPQGTFNPAPPNLTREVLGASPGPAVGLDGYRRDRAAFPSVIGILPAGTRLEVTRIERRTYPGLEPWYEVRARVLSGPFAGREVALARLSAWGPGRVPLVDAGEFTVEP